jgi:two-component system response regulator (stage 0 sporulation protein F)
MTRHEPDKRGDSGAFRILVIDDSPVIRDMLVEVLTDDGYIVDTAVDGQAGGDLALANDYLAILCDVHMPLQNGLETVRRIITSKPEAQIIMTDSLPDKLANQARREGALGCLQKPFDLTELRNLIRRIRQEGTITIDR